MLQTNSTGLSVDWPAAVGPVVTVAATVEVVEVDAVVGAMVGVGMVVERVGAVPPHAESRQMTNDWRKSFLAFIETTPYRGNNRGTESYAEGT